MNSAFLSILMGKYHIQCAPGIWWQIHESVRFLKKFTLETAALMLKNLHYTHYPCHV